MHVIDAARDLAKRAGPVLPVNGKVPLWNGWPKRATRTVGNEPEWELATGVGLVTGADSGFFVVDVDAKGGGLLSLRKLEHKHGRFPRTWRQYTGGGGLQYFFRMPSFPVRNSMAKVGPGIDVRSNGGFVVAPPSEHPNGNRYKWAERSSPWELSLSYAPNCIIELLRLVSRPRFARVVTVVAISPASLEMAGRYLAKIPGAVSGQGGHDQTFWAAITMVRGFALGAEAGFEILWREYNPRCNPPWSEPELRHKAEHAVTGANNEWGWLLKRSYPPLVGSNSSVHSLVTSNRIVEHVTGGRCL